MRIFYDIPESRGLFRSPVMTIGSFDGVHVGHHRILSVLLNIARDKGGDAIVLTFRTHPRKVLTPMTPPKILTTEAEKIRVFKYLGIENVIMLEFTRELAGMSAPDFFNDVILHRFGAIDMVVGYDHAFGRDREGNLDFLIYQSRHRGFAVTRVEPKNNHSRPVSSSWIRTELEDGNISLANALLGREYGFSGNVVRGAGRGRSIGFPTANVVPDDPDKVIPKDGVYAVRVAIDGIGSFGGMLNIGMNPTFSERENNIEVNIFDFAQDIYEMNLDISISARLRDVMKFSSPEELARQLSKDRENARKMLGAGSGE